MMPDPVADIVSGKMWANGLDIVWPRLAALAGTTAVYFGISLMRFRAAIASIR